MKKKVKIEDINDCLDIQEMMDVKGGALDKTVICVLATAVRCEVAGSGVINNPSTPDDK